MKIGFYEIQGWENHFIKNGLKGHSISLSKETLNEKDIKQAKKFEAISVFVYSKIDKKILSELPKLKLIVTRSMGFDHIDVKECKKRGICVLNVPSYGENTVAEHTFALILALSRKVHEAYLRKLNNDFSIEGLKGFDLKNKTLGVIGAGRIGKHVIRIARGFEMNVLVHDKHEDEFLAEQLGFRYKTFEEVLKKSDIVTLHVPYFKENHHLINAQTLKLFKRGAILINTSRGAIVDTFVLLKAINEHRLAGAGLDVIEGEEIIKEEKELLYQNKNVKALQLLVKDHELLSKPNVVFTPHIAFYSQEALERIIKKTINNIEGFIKDKIDKECIVC